MRITRTVSVQFAASALMISTLGTITPTVTFAQSAEARSFEVASVRYVGPYNGGPASFRGGPGTADPAHLVWDNVLILTLLTRAYGVGGFDQIFGPQWMDSEQYTIRANLAPGAPKDDLPKMLQHLLEERFHLAAHYSKKEFSVYELLVAKNGPRLRKSTGDPGESTNGARPRQGPDGFPILPPGGHHAVFQPIENGIQVTRETFRDFSMAELVQELAWPLGEPPSWEHVLAGGRVVDRTGLSGKFDFKLYYAGFHSPGGAFPPPAADGQPSGAPTLFDAVQQQLGLKLQETKALLDVLVVDHIERSPTDN
jgi:uncharacterized protein (TIGR03435 family)